MKYRISGGSVVLLFPIGVMDAFPLFTPGASPTIKSGIGVRMKQIGTG